MRFLINEKGYLYAPDFCNEEKITLPLQTKILGDFAFTNWSTLKEVNLPEGIVAIGSNAFCNCTNLEKINLPESLYMLEDSAFSNCLSLQSIVLPKSLESIKDITFCNCESLKEIALSPTLTSIGDFAFKNCYKLEGIEIPNTTRRIGIFTFANCTNLNKVKLSENLEEINSYCFLNCANLESLDAPTSLTIIREGAFSDCIKLKELKLPKSLVTIESNAFSNCPNIEKISLLNYDNLVQPGIKEHIDISNYAYTDKRTGQLIISKHKLTDPNLKEIIYQEIKDNLNCSTSEAILISTRFTIEDLKKDNLIFIGYFALHLFRNENSAQIIENIRKNNIEFTRLLKKLSIKTYYENKLLLDKENIEIYDLFKLAYNLGAFSDNKIERQKACEFIANIFEKNILSLYTIHEVLSSMELNGYNKEWSNFVMDKNNTLKLLKPLKGKKYYIAETYNEFSNIKEFCRSNKGNQHYRQINFDACTTYFSNIDFKGITEETRDVSETLASFTRNQKIFNEAKSIREEYIAKKKEGTIKDHILDEPLFEEIKREEKKISDNITQTIISLKNTLDHKFTYEFLSKYDSANFVLGKYCSCCSHIEAAGYGVMKASILHPDCQNLIIRNEKGQIVAKSTLYINRKEGYGLFNTIEVNETISGKDRKLIYNKYMKAILEFVQKYNKTFPQSQLKQINVGIHANDLLEELEKSTKESEVILKGIDFSLYGKTEYTHEGDWKQGQRILWKSTIK